MKKQKKEFERVNKGYEFTMASASISFIALVIIFLYLIIEAHI